LLLVKSFRQNNFNKIFSDGEFLQTGIFLALIAFFADGENEKRMGTVPILFGNKSRKLTPGTKCVLAPNVCTAGRPCLAAGGRPH